MQLDQSKEAKEVEPMKANKQKGNNGDALCATLADTKINARQLQR